MATVSARPKPIVDSSPAQLTRYFAAKLAAELGPHNVKRLMDLRDNSFVLVDVRSEEGFRQGHIPGAINIPFEQLPARLRELPKAKRVIVYCWDTTCTLSTKAAYILALKGYRVKEMIGGFEVWKAERFPTE